MEIMPRSSRKFKNNSIFFKLLMFFIILMVLSVSLVGYSSYIYSSRLLVDEVKNHNMLVLKQARDNIDQMIALLDKTTLQIAIDKRVKKAFYLNNNIDPETIVLSQDISMYLSSIKSSSGFIDSIILYFNKSDMVVTDDGKYDMKTFINNIYTETKVPAEKWMEIINRYTLFKTLDEYNTVDNIVQNKNVTFIRSLPIEIRTPYCTVAINVNTEELRKRFGDYSYGNNISNFILDSAGNIIVGTNNNIENYNVINDLAVRKILYNEDPEVSRGVFHDLSVQDKKYSIAVINSQKNDWMYVSVIPTIYIVEKANIIKSVTVVAIGISILLGLILSYTLTTNIYNPISRIVNYIEMIKDYKISWKREKYTDEMSFINRFIDIIFRENSDLSNTINESIPILKEKFLSDLFEGKVDQKNLSNTLSILKLDMPFDAFQVIVFEIDDYSERIQEILEKTQQTVEKIVLDYSLTEPFHKNIRAYSLEKRGGKTLTLINIRGDYGRPEIIYDFINKVTEYFMKNYGISFTVGVGRTYNGLTEIASSYIECLFALKYKIIEGQNRIIHIDEVSNISPTPYDYSFECEKHLINLIKSGDYPGVMDALQNILHENTKKKEITPETLDNLFVVLAGTAVRTVNEISSSIDEVFGQNYNIYEGLSASKTVQQKESYILDVFRNITDYINNRRKSKDEELYNKITDFIAHNYHDDISLNVVSDGIGLSPSYLSWVFKKISGKNFVEYLNAYRIEKAKQLLKESNMSVTKIGEDVGFTNPNTFIRVFKKYEGITPGNYRSSN